jgi:hypothetical protein
VVVALCVVNTGGRGDGAIGSSFFCLLANEKVRPAFLSDHPLDRAAGGTGMSWNGRCAETMEFECESLEMSVDEGIVEELLRRAEDAALP